MHESITLTMADGTRREIGTKSMSSSEFQAFHDSGRMPERFWPEEIAKLKDEYVQELITLEEYEDAHEDMMGFTHKPLPGPGPECMGRDPWLIT